MTIKNKQLAYLVLTLATLVAGYFYLRYAYKVTDSTPFTQEIVLIILGTVATIFITALLLNQQTAVEIEKEQNIKFLDLKTTTYEKLLDLLEELSTKASLKNSDITKLKFVSYRLSIFSSPNVLEEYNKFLTVISNSTIDGTLNNDKEKLSNALSELTIEIRFDLLNENQTNKTYSNLQISKMINQNTNSLNKIEL